MLYQVNIIYIINILKLRLSYLWGGTQGWVGTEEGTVTDNGGHRLIFVPVCTTVDWSRLMLVTVVVRFAGPAVLVLEILSCFDTCFRDILLPYLDPYKFYLIRILYKYLLLHLYIYL